MEINDKMQVPGTPEDLFQQGEAAYGAGDFEAALSLLKQAAEQGCAEAQYKCSVMYLTGKGTSTDITQALMWSERAAEQGFPEAQFNCGISYKKGNGAAVDLARALMWFEKAAEQGYAPSQFNCGTMYENGEGVRADLSKAFLWYGKAAKQGHLAAANNLALMYKWGEAEELRRLPEAVRWEAALFWFEQVIRLGEKAVRLDADSQFLLGAEPGKSVQQLVETARFNYAETLYQRGGPQDLKAALGWFETLGAQGDLEAQRYCAKMYGLGEGTAVDRSREFMWNEAAARQGDARSQFNCAVMCEKGEGTAPDMDKALMWYQAAARNGYQKARPILVDERNKLFMRGNMARQAGDSQTALALYEKCAGLGADIACNLCGIMYATGEGLAAPDLEKAFQWFLEGAKRGDPESQFNCGVMYYNGDGMACRDKAKARQWLQKAAEQTKDMDIQKKAVAALNGMLQ